MNKGYLKATILLALMCFISLLNAFLFKNLNQISLLVILVIFLILSIYFNGFVASHKRFQKDILLILLIYVLSYYFITYISGIIFGFYYNTYNLNVFSIIKNIGITIPLIVVVEGLRYSINYKIRDNRPLLFLSFMAFFLIDTTLTISNINFTSIYTCIDNISLFVIPSIGKNILLTYLSLKQDYKSTILYRLLMEIPVYFVPILPNLGTYLQAVCEFSLPIIILFRIYNFYHKIPLNQDKVTSHKNYYVVSYALSIIFLLAVVSLTSGLFKHQAIVVASGSMSPNLNRGDVVIVNKLTDAEKRELDVNDVLVFHREDKTIVHRIYRKVVTGNEVFFETKGDNNDSSDGYLIELSEVIGTTHFRIRYVGLPTVYLYDLFHS